MFQIKYPKNKQSFEEDYLSIFFEKDLKGQFTIDKYDLQNKLIREGLYYNIKNILTMNFKDLCLLTDNMPYNAFNVKDKENLFKKLKDIFNYKERQVDIAKFFMKYNNELDMKTCYCCNIDYINIFEDLYDYPTAVDFYNNADIEELVKIKNVTENIAHQIIAKRPINKIEELLNINGVTNNKIHNIKNLVLETVHNHFTLDHFIDKGKNPIVSLSLYNLVPACYSCNTKFKGIDEVIKDKKADHFLSPSDKDYSFNENVSFKLANHTIPIKSVNDFTLEFDYKNKKYKQFTDVFKLIGRYKFHKYIAVDMQKQIIDHPKSWLIEMSKIGNDGFVDISAYENLKKAIYGKELFEGELNKTPLLKFKKDIAEQLGILNL